MTNSALLRGKDRGELQYLESCFWRAGRLLATVLQNGVKAEYRRSAHAVLDLKYHVVWITKYRYKVLTGRVAERTRDLIRQICESRDVAIVRGAVSPDHIHMLRHPDLQGNYIEPIS